MQKNISLFRYFFPLLFRYPTISNHAKKKNAFVWKERKLFEHIATNSNRYIFNHTKKKRTFSREFYIFYSTQKQKWENRTIAKKISFFFFYRFPKYIHISPYSHIPIFLHRTYRNIYSMDIYHGKKLQHRRHT